MKKVSVIINCHNGEKYLKKCISSVLNQKYENLEIIFFDNFSNDNSKKILFDFGDPRIKYFYSKKKIPLYEARNEAIKFTNGEIIAFLDVDDWWDEKYLLSRTNLFEDANYDFFYNNVYMFYERNKKYRKYKNFFLPNGKIYNSLAEDYFIIISGLMLRKKIFEKVGFFNKDFNIIGDFDFVMKISREFNAHGLDKPLVYYRVHKNNFSKINSEMFFNEFKSWFENQLLIKNNDFLNNKKHFEKKLDIFEINNLLFNKNKNFYLLKKIIKFPEFRKRLKYLIAFFLPKIILQYLRK